MIDSILGLEDELIRASAEGLYIHNLFQRDDGSWQANVRFEPMKYKKDSGVMISDFCISDSPRDALKEAIDKILEVK